jgi:pilin isopeptide linkage protein
MALLLTVGTIPFQTFAAEANTVSVSLKVESQITGDAAEDAAITYTLVPEDTESIYVMPADEASETVTIEGDGAEEFGPLTFSEVGVYKYTVQVKDEQQPGYTYDKTVFHVTVTVINTDDGKLSAGVFVQRDGSDVKSTDISFTNEYHAPEISMGFDKVDAETGERVSGAVLRVVDANGDTIDEWTSDGTLHTIAGKLTVGETYRLIEVEAPSGYKYAADIQFTAAADETIVMTDEKESEDQTASISVTKELRCSEAVIGAEDQVFYVALYEDQACTHRVTEIKALEFKMASTVTVTFDGLEPNKTYYLGEADVNGINLVSGEVDDGTIFYTDFIQGQAVVANVEAGASTIKFLNEFDVIPDHFYREGELTITKKLVDADGNATNATKTFYAGIFADAGFTTLSDQVSSNIVELQLNNASEASETVKVVLNEEGTTHLYVTEVDASGTPVSQDSSFEYVVTVSGSDVNLTADNTSASVTITNRIRTEGETETEASTETSTEAPTKPTTVKTGDNTPIVQYVLLLAIAAVAVVLIQLRRKQRQ